MEKDFSLSVKQCYHIVSSVEKILESKNPQVGKTNSRRIILLSKFEKCDSKK